MTLLALVSACQPGTSVVGLGGDDHGDASLDTGVEAAPGDTADAAVDDTGEDQPDTWPRACPSLYDQDRLVEFSLDFAAADWGAMQSDCANGTQRYRPVSFSYEGETVAAMARLKGNWSWSCDKFQFVISFNEEDPAARFHGLRKLMLDAPWYDRTVLHERLAFPLFAERGLPYSCANNARVNVNGEYYGLYANLERLDHEYLERNFEDPDGNLYQGGSELKTNEDVADTARLDALRAATTVEAIGALVDLDQAVAEWAMEAMIPAMDNYWAGVEINYYLYDHPDRGFLYLPYDLDISFGDSAYTSGELVWPSSATVDPILYEHTGWRKEALFQVVLADETWCNRFVDALVLARGVYDPATLSAQLQAHDAQVADAYAEDPNAHVSTSERAAAVRQLEAFVGERAAFVDAWLAEGDHCPARW